MRSGFAAVVGRPNVGKSSLVNRFVGEKVTITAPSPNTTRRVLRGVVRREGSQLVVVDTPGLHRPRSELGTRLNDLAAGSVADVEAVVAVLDATARVGPGDRRVLERSLASRASADAPQVFVVVNKVDAVPRRAVVERLAEAAAAVEAIADATEAARVEYFAVSARTGEGTEALLSGILETLEEGPEWFGVDEVSDLGEEERIAELVREALLDELREELPHAIHCRVTSLEWPVVEVEVLVERESQKGIVIGKGGQLLKRAGTRAREQLPEGCYLSLRVAVEPRWSSRGDVLDRLGY